MIRSHQGRESHVSQWLKESLAEKKVVGSNPDQPLLQSSTLELFGIDQLRDSFQDLCKLYRTSFFPATTRFGVSQKAKRLITGGPCYKLSLCLILCPGKGKNDFLIFILSYPLYTYNPFL